MSDFIQNSMIMTLQNLTDRPTEDIEAEIAGYAATRKITLLLPALFSEFTGPAMPHIVDELRKVPYLHRIVLSLDQADEAQFQKARTFFHDFRCPVRTIWQNSPPIQKLYRDLDESGFYVGKPGKGRSVWLSLGYILAAMDTEIIALHDCDIVTYDRVMLSRLVYPIANPNILVEFSKGYFARHKGKLFGRATRLFVTPLILALEKVLGKLPFLEYLNSFRYPLSGEFAMLTDIAGMLRITPDYGLEMITLGEVYKSSIPARICQVDLLDNYEHKHQPLSTDSGGLTQMVKDISRALFRTLTEDGVVLDEARFRSLRVTYIRFAREAVIKYHALAKANGLSFDRHEEISAVESFAQSLLEATGEFMNDPIGTPMMPAWQRVFSAQPDFGTVLTEIVEGMN